MELSRPQLNLLDKGDCYESEALGSFAANLFHEGNGEEQKNGGCNISAHALPALRYGLMLARLLVTRRDKLRPNNRVHHDRGLRRE